VRFRSVVVLGGKTATGFQVPADVVAGLGQGKRPPVRVTIAGHTYRSTVAVMGGEYWLGISAEVRGITGVRADDEVDVDVELDTELREVVVPADFAAALDGDGEARHAFDGLSYSNRRRLVMAIEDAKTDETRQRRIGKTVELLREGRA
jgi:hypothetical protein